MKRILEFLKSPHIQIALATGICIIVMAYFSKRVLSEPIAYLLLAIPPFIATLYEAVLKKYENSWISKTWIWVVLILLSTFLVILLSGLRTADKPLKVEVFPLPDGFRIPYDVSDYYEEHHQILDSLFTSNSEMRRVVSPIRKLNKPEPQKYTPLKLNGDTYSLLYLGGQMEGMDRVEEYKILLNDEKIYEFRSRAPIPIDHIHGFFIWQNDWILEFYNTIVINGVNLNEKYDYEAAFFVSVVGNELFYFAKKEDQIYLVQNNKLTDYKYDNIIAYQCCDYDRYNPLFSKNILSFFAQIDSKMYYVQIIVNSVHSGDS